MISVKFTRIDPRAQAPAQAHPGEDAGWDLFSLEDVDVNLRLYCGFPSLTWIRTGIAMALPPGYYGRIVGRSSAASKGFHVIEGVMDAGYRGEQLVRVAPCWNPQDRPHATPSLRILAGTALAQLIVSPIPAVEMAEVDELPPSLRGKNGFGSSGRHLGEVDPRV